jgi:plasmid stabilization system protein ParE
MTLPAVRFLPEALEELLETQRWYGKREPALANDFAQTVAAAVERIRHSPQSFPLIHGRIRRLVLSRFPYAVVFREQGDEIPVIALHGHQEPRRW